MKQFKLNIKNIPALVLGLPSDKLYIFIHGQGGQKEDAFLFAELASNHNYQVLSIDLPEHGERKSESTKFTPWDIVPELLEVFSYAQVYWKDISILANSIGAWFSLLAFKNEHIKNCIFISPLLDMAPIIKNMMQFDKISEKELYDKKFITTSFGQELSLDYFMYTKNNPIKKWPFPTDILYPENDHIVDYIIVDTFSKKFKSNVTIAKNFEHWFHTEEQLSFLKNWLSQKLETHI